jgi:hypothetical protein
VRADQIAGDDEEHIDTDIATGEVTYTDVIEQDHNDCNSAQAVDIGTIACSAAGNCGLIHCRFNLTRRGKAQIALR